MKAGFIGLGAMDGPMTERVVKAGFETFTAFHQRCEPADLAGVQLSRPEAPERATGLVGT